MNLDEWKALRALERMELSEKRRGEKELRCAKRCQ